MNRAKKEAAGKFAPELNILFRDTPEKLQPLAEEAAEALSALLRELARLALERGCGRLEWACLDWNAPSIAFYRARGAVPMEDWTTYRLTGESLRRMAGEQTGGAARRALLRVRGASSEQAS